MTEPVSQKLYQMMADTISPDFAFSYLVAAKQDGTWVIPHTLTAWDRLTGNGLAMRVIHDLGLRLVKPIAWHPNRDKPKP